MERISKDAAAYTPVAKGPDHCRDCRHFEVVAKRTCEAVYGEIAPGGWCKLFAEKHSLAKVLK